MKRALTSLLAVLLLLCGCQGGQKAADGDAAAEFGTHYRGSYHTVSAAVCPDYFCVAGERIYTASSADSAVIRSCALDGSGETSFAMPYVSADFFDGTPMVQNVYGMFAGDDCLYVLEFASSYTESEAGGVMIRTSHFNLLLHTLEFSGEERSVLDLSAALLPPGNGYPDDLNRLYVSPEGEVYALKFGGGLDVLAPDGTKKLSLGSEIGYCDLLTPQGGPVLLECDGTIYSVNWENQALDRRCDLPGMNYSGFYSGVEGYDFTYSNGMSLFGVKLEAGETALLLTFLNCGVDAATMAELLPTEDGMRTIHLDRSNGSWGIHTLTRSSGGSDSKTVLTLASAAGELDDSIHRAILRFNQTSPDFCIEVRDYAKYATVEDSAGGISVLATELISGKTPDIFVTDGLALDAYAARGILEDLWPYIDGDTELGGRDALVLPVLQAMSHRSGALYQIAPDFSISAFVASREVIGEDTELTLAGVEELCAAQGEDFTAFGDSSRTNAKYLTAYHVLEDYVNWQENTCSFDSPEFRQLLTFILEHFAADSYPSGGPYARYTAVATGQQLLASATIFGFHEMQIIHSIFHGNEVFVGWPGEQNGGTAFSIYGGLAMCAASEHKDAAWDFMRLVLTEENQLGDGEPTQTFHTNKRAFTIGLEKAMFAGYVTDERGEKVLDADGEPIEQSPGRVMVESYDGSLLSFELENMTQQQADRLTALIEGTGKLRDCDESIFTIFSEELNALFDGQQDIDQTAKAIQHRAELYIAEQGE